VLKLLIRHSYVFKTEKPFFKKQQGDTSTYFYKVTISAARCKGCSNKEIASQEADEPEILDHCTPSTLFVSSI
jgi:hypothetical protein